MSFPRTGLVVVLLLTFAGQLTAQDASPAKAAPAQNAAPVQNAAPASGADAAGRTIELEAATAEVAEAVKAYVAAFNARDIKTLGAMWTEGGVYTMRTSGERVVGREAITELFKPILADEKNAPKLAVESASIEFVSPRVALERGRAIVSRGEEETSESEYTVVYVKDDGKWLIDRITEDDIVYVASHYDNLKGLEWMIGDWVDAGEGFTIDIQCDWTTNRNFISRKYVVSNDQGAESSGLQIIGWDAREKTIRSWLFDSDGGFVSGTWSERDGVWVAQSVVTLADGARGSSTSVFKPQDDGTYTWKKINRVLDGKLLPNIDEIVVQPR